MTYYHHTQTGQIIDEQDGQIIATTSDSATPQQAELLAAAPVLLALCERAFRALSWDDFPQLKDELKSAIERVTP
jgi:hypothetical protein